MNSTFSRARAIQVFRLTTAKFVADNSKLILEGNEEEQSRIRNVIFASIVGTLNI